MIPALLAAAAVSVTPDTTAAVLDRVRQALRYQGMAQQASGVLIRGKSSLMGGEGDYSLVFDGAGRFALETTGRLGRTLAFDGTTAWEIGFQGTPRVLELGDRANGLLKVWCMTGQWLAPGAPLHFAEAPTADGDQAVSIAFDMDERRMTGAVRVSTATWLPERFMWESGARTETLTPSGYAEHAGMMLPEKVEDVQHGSADSYTLASAGPAPSYVRSPYEPRLAMPAAKFESSPAALEVVKAKTGHLLVKPKIGGKELGWFIFDTGAGSTVIDPAVAKGAGLEPFGNVSVVGVGGGAAGAFYRPSSLTLGPATIESPVMAGTDLSFLNAPMGETIAGVVGYDLLSRCIAEIDLTEGRVALYDPAKYTLPRGKWIDAVVYQRHLCVPGSFEGHKGLLKLDTGANGDVTIHAPAVKEFELLKGRETKPAGLGGVGGMVPAAMGTLASLEVGGKTFENVSATFATEAKGAFGDVYTSGNVGNGILVRFVLVVDFGGRRVAMMEKEEGGK